VVFPIAPQKNLWCDVIIPNFPLLLTLAVLFLLSVIWLLSLVKWENNTRIKGEVKDNITIEMAAFFATYILPLIFIDFDLIGIIISIVIFLVFAIAFIASDKHFLNPTFILFGYKLYRVDDKCVLFRKSMDALKIKLIENKDGVSVRELVRNTYIVLPK